MKPKSPNFRLFNYLLLWILGGGLLYLAFKDQPTQDIWLRLQEADWRWALLITGISLFNHVIRALRWQLLLNPLRKRKVSVFYAFIALQAGYLVNLAIPRLGEISRCIGIKKAEDMPVKPVLGTVITERVIDVFCLIVTVFFALIVELDDLYSLYLREVYPSLESLFNEKAQSVKYIGTALVLCITLGLAFILLRWKFLRKYKWWRFFLRFGRQVWSGASSIQRLEQKGLFLLYNLIIWIGYYAMTYLWFYSFEETSGLGWKVGLVMLVIGSIGRSLPIQGGAVGAYHYIYVQGMAMYGISEVYAGSLAIMTHGLQLILNLIIGGLSALMLMGAISFGAMSKRTQE